MIHLLISLLIVLAVFLIGGLLGTFIFLKLREYAKI